uniref:Dynein heavy chain coiled coil stalk domain-containing protein n=1 Tax=Plectus sambesii TaxID=2011161 RepID=A0A914V2S6_9BILA
EGSEEERPVTGGDDLLQAFLQMYDRCPPGTATPRTFIAFVQTYQKVYREKKQKISERFNRLQAGVSKLTEAKELVAKLRSKAAKKSKLLAEKQAEADKALSAITTSMTAATDQKGDMESLKSATEKENVLIEQQKKVIEAQLAEVEPLIQEAREAVGAIKSESLTEIRSLRAPPEAIRDILQAVLLFMGIMDTSWEAMRKFLAKSGVKDEIINFDAHRVTPDIRKKVEVLLKQKEASFDPKNAKRASVAAAPLASWVTANLKYAAILEKIAPLEGEKDKLLKFVVSAVHVTTSPAIID